MVRQLVRRSALFLLLAPAALAAEPPVPVTAAYLGQKLPGEKPERFAPPLLAGFPFLGRCAFSPDGRECFFTMSAPAYVPSRILLTRFEKGAWTTPVPAPFAAGAENTGEPWFTRDGKHLIFTALAKGKGADQWQVERTAQGWSQPTRLPAPVNSGANDFCYSQLPDGTVYFLSNRSGAPQIYRTRPKTDGTLAAELLPAPVLSVGTFEGDPAVPADGRFMVFYSGRPGGYGRVDLYVSFADGKGGWTVPVNLGPDFNTAAEEFGATLTLDGKYLFFTRHSQQKSELWWVSTQAIDRLRH